MGWTPIESAPDDTWVFLKYDDGEVLADDNGEPMAAIWHSDMAGSDDKTDGNEWWCRSGIEAGGVIAYWGKDE